MKKIMLLALLGLSLIVISYYGYRTYQNKVKNDKLMEVLTTSLYRDQAKGKQLYLSLNSEALTFGEAIDIMDSNVSYRNNLLVDINSIYPEIDIDFRDSITNFLNFEINLCRSVSSYSKHTMSYDEDMRKYIYYVRENNSSYYVNYHAEIKEAEENMISAIQSRISNTKEVINQYNQLSACEKHIEVMMKKRNIRFITNYNNKPSFVVSISDALPDMEKDYETLVHNY